MSERKKRTPVVTARTKPCPNLPKGQHCPLCGGAFICLQSWRPKASKPDTATK